VIIALLYHLYHRTVVPWIAIAALVLCNKLQKVDSKIKVPGFQKAP